MKPPQFESETINGHRLIHGESLAILREFNAGVFDAVVTDPPYCSSIRGGSHKQSSASKYTSSETVGKFPEFIGDGRDQRSFLLWCVLWLSECHRVCRDGSAAMIFCDYRNLAAMIDAVQASGWVFDGVVPWIKKNSRPRLGWFQTSFVEYVIVGRKGKTPTGQRTMGPAALSGMPPTKRQHQTQKPVDVVRQLLEFRSDWQKILDPFAGSGTTVLAANQIGRTVTAIEQSDHYLELMRGRVSEISNLKSEI